jgi:hypothetical protein
MDAWNYEPQDLWEAFGSIAAAPWAVAPPLPRSAGRRIQVRSSSRPSRAGPRAI